jgi:hypothetical protein
VAGGRGAIAELSTLAEPHARVLLVADENTYAAAGKATEAALGARVAARVIFPGAPLLIPDERAIAQVNERLFDIEGELYHPDCAEELFLKYTEDYEA